MHPFIIDQMANEHYDALVADAQRRQRARDAKHGRRSAGGRRRPSRLLHLW